MSYLIAKTATLLFRAINITQQAEIYLENILTIQVQLTSSFETNSIFTLEGEFLEVSLSNCLIQESWIDTVI
jgi:hypothetical protein